MNNILGIPVEFFLSAILILIGAVRQSDKKIYDNQISELKEKVSTLEKQGKELSKEEFNEVKALVKECVGSVIDGRDFREEIKNMIKDCLLHADSNRSKAESSTFELIGEKLISQLTSQFKDEIKKIREEVRV